MLYYFRWWKISETVRSASCRSAAPRNMEDIFGIDLPIYASLDARLMSKGGEWVGAYTPLYNQNARFTVEVAVKDSRFATSVG